MVSGTSLEKIIQEYIYGTKYSFDLSERGGK